MRTVYWHRQLPPLDAEAIDERVEPKFDDTHGEAWLHGRYTYMLYR